MNALYGDNSFDDCGDRLSESDLNRVEDRIGVRFPASLREHYLHCNGGQPAKRQWTVHEDGVEKEYLIYYVVAVFYEIQNNGNNDGILEVYQDGIKEGYLPSSFIPFARDQGGNPFCVDASSGHVIWYVLDIWDEDSTTAENMVAATTYVAPDFRTFVEGLVEEEDWDEDE